LNELNKSRIFISEKTNNNCNEANVELTYYLKKKLESKIEIIQLIRRTQCRKNYMGMQGMQPHP